MKIIKYLLTSFVFLILMALLLYFHEIINQTFMIIVITSSFILHLVIFVHFLNLYNEFNKINETMENIIDGNLDIKLITTKYQNNKELPANINRLIKKMEKMTFKKEEDEQTINILTNNITSPIIYIDIDGKVRYVNNQFYTHFKVNINVNDMYEKIKIKKIFKFIDDAFVFENNQTLVIQVGQKYYQSSAITINNLNKFVGILFIFQDITELKKYEKLQREFLADASHELKTPLSAIKGASEILLSGEHSQETIKEFLKIIRLENERMERVVSDILLLSRLENENFTIKSEEIDLKILLDKVIEIMRFRLEQKNQKLITDISSNLLIDGDYERLMTAFLNLLSNAINYTDSDKAIYINAYKESNKIIVSIRDEGIGIDQADIPFIFKRFYRVDKNRSRETGGTGLGLAIVKSTLDIHKATIEVNSKLHEGTTFIITFIDLKKSELTKS